MILLLLEFNQSKVPKKILGDRDREVDRGASEVLATLQNHCGTRPIGFAVWTIFDQRGSRTHSIRHDQVDHRFGHRPRHSGVSRMPWIDPKWRNILRRRMNIQNMISLAHYPAHLACAP